MKISGVIGRVNEKVQEILNALSNRLTAEDNWGPEGEKYQVLASRGPRPGDPPPTFMSIQDILTGISDGNTSVLPPGPSGPAGPAGPPGETGTSGEILRGASWSNSGNVVDLSGQTKGVTPRMQLSGTITAAYILGQGLGSATFGVRKSPEAGFPAWVDITGGVDPSIVVASAADVALTGWTTSVAEGDVFEIELKSVSVFTQVELVLEITPS